MEAVKIIFENKDSHLSKTISVPFLCIYEQLVVSFISPFTSESKLVHQPQVTNIIYVGE